ncbi:MAG TPA: IgGFc-binding protein, partial [Polyangiaceae bacterium]|nr:IgGFc-binding protein [Polyangiaceae bacterium]
SIGNGNLVPAHVVIEKAGVQVVTVDVPANSATTVQLDFDPALKAAGASSLVRAGAYHLRADVPVTVHQFNPLLFEIPQKCQDSGDGAGAQPCYSYTNDASLLFPASALATDPEDGDPGIQYLTASRATWLAGPEQGSLHGFSGFVAVVAVGPGPAVVRVTTSANTLPSAPGAEPIPALAPGDTFQCTLAPGDVLQLASAIPSACTGMQSGTPSDPTPAIEYCDPGAQFDLTRTEVSADGPIEVISGHDCTNVPFDRPACDHLEDAMLPLRAWGKSVVVTRPHVNGDDSYVLRVVSGADGNTISFDPAVQAPITLGRAQSFELTADEPLFVQGTGPLMAAQYLVGQGQPTASVGDPSLALAVPVDQYRRTYNFISPSTYTSNYVDIVAATGDLVTLDGAVISLFQPIGQSRFSVVTVPLQQAGAHELRGTGAAGLGVMLYGVAYYTSYMLPGGLDLRTLTVSGF